MLKLSAKGEYMTYKKIFTSKNIIFTFLVILLLILLPKITNILMMFFAAYVLACALNPYVTQLMKRMNRTMASTVVLLSSLLALVALFIPIIFVAFREIKTFMISLPHKISDAATYILTSEFYGHKLTDLVDIENILGNTSSFAQGLFNHSWTFTMGLVQVIVIFIAITMIVYYILLDKTYLKNKFIEFFPPDMKNKASDILTTISSRVGSYVRAQLLSMTAVGVMVMLILFILRVEYATLLGLISGILDIIPILGPSIALAVILLVAYPLGLTKLILVIAGFLLVQQISNYIVRPVLFGKMMALHPLMIFLALFLAQQFLGFWGVILSPAIASTVCVLIDELYLTPMNLKVNDEK